MRLIIQRVSSSKVFLNNGKERKLNGKISKGINVLVGITHDDNQEDINYIVKKITGLRIFEDEDGKMNLDLKAVNGEILLISQFTLYGDSRKGNRPSFIEAARPELAIPIYNELIMNLRDKGYKVETGEFGADMEVEIINDGPVTILVDSKKQF
ncbi:MAG: D-aminoacyl-tRNA deacylase [Filifactoraceae bacterium]